MLQKAIRIVNHTDYYEPTNPLFLRLYTRKLEDVVNLNKAVITSYKAHDNTLLCCVQEFFEARENQYTVS